MNFLSHYHFYKTGDPYYNTGLVLPDLARNISKAHLKPLDHYADPVYEALGEGCRHHLEADRIFHQSVFFKTCAAHISSLLDSRARWPRKWFLNHLLLEIGLDRVLMDQFPNLCEDFYHQLELADSQKITSFLIESGLDDPGNFRAGYERFVNFRFIFDYAHNEKIFFALSRVYLRTGIEYDWTAYDQDILVKMLPQILGFISRHIYLLEQELK